jgi:2',3'-cyclic-nucleotide 2'-phosphodiesterase / 3'-nucleotidase
MKTRIKRLYHLIFLVLLLIISCKKAELQTVSIIETTDIHGVILPWDYTENKPLDASLAGAATYIKNLRNSKETVFLVDNGDNLQGQPEVYYYNFIDTVSPHLLSEAMNWLDYDACAVGNHDIEAGHSVYDRLAEEYKFPLLAANAVDVKTGKPYFTPFVILKKANIRIAVLGMITPAIPTWLPEKLYSGMEFRDMVETARLWMPVIKKQKPDLVVGLFHSGWDTQNENYKLEDSLNENETAAVAWKVPGFDIIFCGHDHRLANERFVNSQGDTVLILNAGSRSEFVARADIKIYPKRRNRGRIRSISGDLVAIKDYAPDPEFLDRFKSQDKTIREYVARVIGNSPRTITSRDSYFGPSACTDMVHSIQLEITGADISFAAPLSFDVEISKGPVTVGDVFKLYRYENMLYTMSMTGDEIRKYLEYSYSEWINTMKGPEDFLLKYRLDKHGNPIMNNGRAWLANASYNFDSGAGITYTVDASKPDGDRITISSFTDGRPFDLKKTYKVALNSYRGSGGGGHLTRGAGIKQEDLRARQISLTDRDLRYYIQKSVESKKVLNPVPIADWKFIPESWVKVRIPREYLLLFGTNK